MFGYRERIRISWWKNFTGLFKDALVKAIHPVGKNMYLLIEVKRDITIKMIGIS